MTGEASSSMCSNVCKEMFLDSLLEDEESDGEESHAYNNIRMLQSLEDDEETRDRVLSKAKSIDPEPPFTDDDEYDPCYQASRQGFPKRSPSLLQQPFPFGRRHRHMRQARLKAEEVYNTSGLELWRACEAGDFLYVQQTLLLFPHLIHLEQQGRTPLFLACQAGHVAIVEVLLQAGAMDMDGTVYTSSEHPECRALLQQYKIIDDTLNGTTAEEVVVESSAHQDDGDGSCSTPRMENLSCFTPKEEALSPLGAVATAARVSSIMRTVSTDETAHMGNVSREVLEDAPIAADDQVTELAVTTPDGNKDGEEKEQPDEATREESESSERDGPAISDGEEEENDGVSDDETVYETIEYEEREFLMTRNRGNNIVAQASTLIRNRTLSGVKFLKRSMQPQRATRSSITCPASMRANDEEDSVVVIRSNVLGFSNDAGDVDDDNMTLVSVSDIGDTRHLDTMAPTTLVAPFHGPTRARSLFSEQRKWTTTSIQEEEEAMSGAFSSTIRSYSMTSDSQQLTPAASEAEEDEEEDDAATQESTASTTSDAATEDLEVEILNGKLRKSPSTYIGRPFFTKRFTRARTMFPGKANSNIQQPTATPSSNRTFARARTTQLHISVSVEDKEGNETDEMSCSMEEYDETEESSTSCSSSSSEKYTLYSESYTHQGESPEDDFFYTLSAGLFGPPELAQR